MGRESASIGCLVFSVSVKEDSNNGQGANTFGRLIDLDRLPIRFHRRLPKIKKPTEKPNLSDGVRLFVHYRIAFDCTMVIYSSQID